MVGTGDYNGNGVVDAADYVVWRNMLGQAGPGLAADGNGNGAVDAADYDFWRSRFGKVIGGGVGAAATVPEPASWVLFATGLAHSAKPQAEIYRYTRSGLKSANTFCAATALCHEKLDNLCDRTDDRFAAARAPAGPFLSARVIYSYFPRSLHGF